LVRDRVGPEELKNLLLLWGRQPFLRGSVLSFGSMPDEESYTAVVIAIDPRAIMEV
jgi:hypothetical protein